MTLVRDELPWTMPEVYERARGLFSGTEEDMPKSGDQQQVGTTY